MTKRMDIYEPKLPAAIRWPLYAVSFPFALLTAVVWIPFFLLRRREPPVNRTPCGGLCKFGWWDKYESIWRCSAYQGLPTQTARPTFTTKKDPNNCAMFERKP